MRDEALWDALKFTLGAAVIVGTFFAVMIWALKTDPVREAQREAYWDARNAKRIEDCRSQGGTAKLNSMFYLESCTLGPKP